MKLLSTVIVLLAVAQANASEPVVVTKNLTLKKNAILPAPLIIGADGITIDGNGATILGPGKAGDRKSFVGVGVESKGRSNVTIRNLKVRGFATGLVASGGGKWRIEGCDFSDNYHDPDHGWGDGPRYGGIILTGISRSVLRANRACRVWNGLDLRGCNDNLIEDNTFSHCSNVCLKMWNACGNRVLDNTLSWGLRMKAGEVHARDSTSVLIESGSNDNRFKRNDITHGGDGIFIRPLNGWVSTRNVFVANDCSYANNNGFESWSPGNTFIRNKANHCSYGFWLGGSDRTVLIGNEASHNGLASGKHNAPESDFGHGGIVIVGGQGHHSVIDGNICRGNNGGGIVFRGDLGSKGSKWRMLNLIVQNNVLEGNKWGIFARFTDGLFLANNRFVDNKQDELLEAVTNVQRGRADPKNAKAPTVVLTGPSRSTVGRSVVFDASKSTDALGRKLTYHWTVGDKAYDTQRVEHVFRKAGFHRVYLTASNGYLAGSAFKDFYVTRPGREFVDATEDQAARWGWTMGNNADSRGKVTFTDVARSALVGRTSLHVRPDPYKGSEVTAIFPKSKDAAWALADKKDLVFWIRFRNPNNGGFQGVNPIVRLHAGDGAYTYLPAENGSPVNLLGRPPYAEARYGWLHVRIPLTGEKNWIRIESLNGAVPQHVDNTLAFDTTGTPVRTQTDSAMVSTGRSLFLATREGDKLWRSTDGRKWTPCTSAAAALKCPSGGWENQMLCYWASGGKGKLAGRHQDPRRDEHGKNPWRYVLYDIETDTWSWSRMYCTPSHGLTVVGDMMYGLAHAVGGNYGGPVTRVNLASMGAIDERTELTGLKDNKDNWWFSRAAKLTTLAGKIYGIKNDWTTPRPATGAEGDDRMFVFDPKLFAPSKFAGGFQWKEGNWQVARTKVSDLGALPFEAGHGSALTPLPPNWSPAVGAKGGLFIIAGCSPSNHEGWGPPSDLYAIYDAASGKFTLGRLPNVTGSGTSATFHGGKIIIKRGGVRYGPADEQLWTVTPLSPDRAQAAADLIKRQRMSLKKVDHLSIQFDSSGEAPFDIFLDGLTFE